MVTNIASELLKEYSTNGNITNKLNKHNRIIYTKHHIYNIKIWYKTDIYIYWSAIYIYIYWSAFNDPLSLTQVCVFQTLIFIARFLRFVFYIVRISDQGCFEVYNQCNLLDRMLEQHSYQPCPQDVFTNI